MAEGDIPVDPILFEYWCADQLSAQGWDVALTPQSGDAGIDLVAETSGFVMVVQCKRSARPAGVAAVQQAVSGREFLKADLACVISTSGFTRSAMSFGEETRALLLRANELSPLQKYLRPSPVKDSREQSPEKSRSDFENRFQRYGKASELITLSFHTAGHVEIAAACDVWINQAPHLLRGGSRLFLESLVDGKGAGRISVKGALTILRAADEVFHTQVKFSEENYSVLISKRGKNYATDLRDSNPEGFTYYQLFEHPTLASVQAAYRHILETPEVKLKLIEIRTIGSKEAISGLDFRILRTFAIGRKRP